MVTSSSSDSPSEPPAASGPWLTRGVAGIGAASLLSDLGHEVPTSLLPSFLTSTLGAPAAALGLVEGIADGLSGAAKLAGGALADDPGRRRSTAVGSYTATAVFSGLIGAAAAPWQAGVLRAGAWTARGLRGPSRNALLADAAPKEAYGRAFGFERAMDNLGAILGPLLGIVLVAAFGIRTAILVSIVPGLLAAGAVVDAVRHIRSAGPRDRRPVRLSVRPVLRGRLRWLLAGIGAFEFGNVAATLLILRATELLEPAHGIDAAAQIALGLYTAYNAAAALSSVPAGRFADRRGATSALAFGVGLFLVAYLLFAGTGASVPLLAAGFVTAGVAMGAVETAEHAAVATQAPQDVRGSAFGLLGVLQSMGNLAASGVAGLLWTLVAPAAAFLWAAGWMAVSLLVLGSTTRSSRR